MKTLFKAILLVTLMSASTQASSIICKYNGDRDELDMSVMKINLGKEEDAFSTDSGENFSVAPIEGNRFKWVILDFGKYKITFDAKKGEFQYLRKGKVESLAKVECSGVKEAMLADSLENMPSKLINPKESDLNKREVADLSRKADDFKAPRDSDSSVSGSANK